MVFAKANVAVEWALWKAELSCGLLFQGDEACGFRRIVLRAVIVQQVRGVRGRWSAIRGLL